MDQNKEKKGLENYLPYMIAGVLLVCVVVGAVLLFGGKDQPNQPIKPTGEPVQSQTDDPSLQNPTEDTVLQPTEENQPTDGNIAPTDPTDTAPTEPTDAPTTEPSTPPATEPKPTEVPPTEAEGHAHTVLLDIPEMWSDYMSRELIQLDNGSRQIFYTEVQGSRVDLFGVTFGFVDESKGGFSMGYYKADCGDMIKVAIESYQPVPASSWTEADSNRVNAMREEINTIIGQLRQILVD